MGFEVHGEVDRPTGGAAAAIRLLASPAGILLAGLASRLCPLGSRLPDDHDLDPSGAEVLGLAGAQVLAWVFAQVAARDSFPAERSSGQDRAEGPIHS